MFDLVIIGGGPAGIAAGIYAARKQLKTLLISKDLFGQIAKTTQVDNYPGFFGISGIDLASKLSAHLKNFDVDVKEGETIVGVEKEEQSFKVISKKNEVFQAKAIIVSAGSQAKKLGIGEEKFVGKGVSYCSICDAPFFRDKIAAVVGGGNSGAMATLDLAKYAKKVFLFEKNSFLQADEFLQEKIKQEPKIELMLKKNIIKVEGKEKIEKIRYQDQGKKELFVQAIDGLFVEVGMAPADGFLKGLVDLNDKGEIMIDHKTCQTSQEGIFACGDITDGLWKQYAIAVGEGAKAALSAYDYLTKK